MSIKFDPTDLHQKAAIKSGLLHAANSNPLIQKTSPGGDSNASTLAPCTYPVRPDQSVFDRPSSINENPPSNAPENIKRKRRRKNPIEPCFTDAFSFSLQKGVAPFRELPEKTENKLEKALDLTQRYELLGQLRVVIKEKRRKYPYIQLTFFSILIDQMQNGTTFLLDEVKFWKQFLKKELCDTKSVIEMGNKLGLQMAVASFEKKDGLLFLHKLFQKSPQPVMVKISHPDNRVKNVWIIIDRMVPGTEFAYIRNPFEGNAQRISISSLKNRFPKKAECVYFVAEESFDSQSSESS